MRKRLGTVQTDHVTNLLHNIEELVEIDRSCECNVTKVTWTELIGLLTGWTYLTILNDTETAIEHAIGDRLIALVGLVGGHFHNGTLTDVLGIGNAELNAYNSVAHVVSLLSLRVYSSVFYGNAKQ